MATRKKNDISRPEEQLSMEQKAFDELCTLIEELNDKGEYWLTLENKNIIFNVKLRAVFPDFFDSTINIPKSSMRKYMRGKVQQSYGDFSGFSLMSLDECAAGFLTSSMNLAFYRSRGFDITEYVVICEEDGKKPLLYDGKKTRTFRQSNPQNNVMYIPLHFISKDAVDSWNARNVAASMIQSRLMPSSKLSDELQHYQDLVSLINECSKGAREITSDGKVMEKEQTIFEKTDPKRDFSSSAQAVILNEDEKRLLECDKRRFSFITYEKDRLYDLGNGHWDLYDGAKAEGRNTYRAENGYIARNPLLDVQKNGVVAIDFGTKSTVVVYKNGSSMKIPMRIGTTNYQKVSNLGSQFENPTVEEFVDLKSFFKVICAKKWKAGN